MIEYSFNSSLSLHLERFVNMKKALEYDPRRIQSVLKEFDNYLLCIGWNDDTVTQDIVDGWRETLVNNSPSTIYKKMVTISQFCKYLAYSGHPCYIPRLPRYHDTNFVPKVFTSQEMEKIFSECDNLRISTRVGDCHFWAVPTIIRFLYCTGVRINEALTLTNENVDLERREITLLITKNKQHRIIPINDSLSALLNQYLEERKKLKAKGINDADSFFFISPFGRPLASGVIYFYFKRVLKACGIPHMGKCAGPRIHDLRHTFAVHSMVKMLKEGLDLYCALSYLSVFLGHKDPKDTERYVRLTKDMYPYMLKQEEEVVTAAFPKIYNETNEQH